MLDMQSMASNGQHPLPFGYDQHELQGLGLPPYLEQSLPHGRPLLSEQESNNMNYFFSNMASDGQIQPQPVMNNHYHNNMAQLHPLQMPNTYVGSETYMQPQQQQTMDWNNQQMSSYPYSGHPTNMSALQSPTSPFTNGHSQGHMLSQTSPIFSPQPPQNMQSLGAPWQQTYRPQNQISHPRTDMHFGTDPHFLNTGYVPPEGSGTEVDLTVLNHAIYPTSSGSNTRPNSRPASNPNTEPSSPIATKRRKLNAFQNDALRMTAMDVGPQQVGPSPPLSGNPRKARKSSVKNENIPVAALHRSHIRDDEAIAPDEDAEYDDDGSTNHQASPPAPWPASKARPAHKPSQPPKPTKSRKKSTSVAIGRQALSRRQSSTTTNTATRVPLTAEQKKANHTNSEQRRRDATSKAYADLYDLVPEIEEGGKQSTMKKLHSVVNKVEAVSERLAHLRQLLGKDLSPGHTGPDTGHQQYGNGISQMHHW